MSLILTLTLTLTPTLTLTLKASLRIVLHPASMGKDVAAVEAAVEEVLRAT